MGNEKVPHYTRESLMMSLFVSPPLSSPSSLYYPLHCQPYPYNPTDQPYGAKAISDAARHLWDSGSLGATQ